MNFWKVIKFGGTSVSSLDRWQDITTIIRNHLTDGGQIFVVCSAVTQISNLLEKLIQHALHDEHHEILTEIQARHQKLADDLSLDLNDITKTHFDELTQLAQGIALLKEASPRVRAQIMAFGELILTKLGAAFLQKQGIDVSWQHAGDLLHAETQFNQSDEVNYLNARCNSDRDEKLITNLSAIKNRVVITQGFFARNQNGETVLLGRGGSDASAAYFAAKMQAEFCEIWTDVPGVYTANPHNIPQARILPSLDYDEAQEIAAMGGKVLHPNSVAPLKNQNIPLYIKFTADPTRAGTKVCFGGEDLGLPIKSILTKNNLMLINIETINMWHQVGFLADIFAIFKQHKYSIDLISTSESSITVSLDTTANLKKSSALDHLLMELNKISKATLIQPCASVSLVGRNIRAVMHQLTPILEVFASQKIYMLSLANNDLNLTLVMESDQADRIAKKLHALLIENHPRSYYHLSWQAEFGQYIEQPKLWWQDKVAQLLKLSQDRSPLYVYDAATIQKSIDNLLAMKSVDQFFYAMKANPHRQILQQIFLSGIGFECVSINEVNLILELFPEIDRKKILFTPNFAPKTEYQQSIALGINVTIDSLHPITNWPELFTGQEIFVRIDPGQGAGHHKYVCTAGSESKFGIALSDIEILKKITLENNIHIVGLHAHSGSGILSPELWSDTALLLSRLLSDFPEVRVLDLGGGLGVVEKPGQEALNLQAVGHNIAEVKALHPDKKIWMEPGRYLVAHAGIILAKVTQVKQKGEVNFVGIDAGMNSLIRPALYGAYHEIVNLSKLNAPKTLVANVVGPICESGDTLGYSRFLPDTVEGDVVLIANTGAYGHCMSTHYNLRKPAEEIYIL